MEHEADQKPKPNELFDFMRQISAELASEYDRIRKRAIEDPGTAEGIERHIPDPRHRAQYDSMTS